MVRILLALPMIWLLIGCNKVSFSHTPEEQALLNNNVMDDDVTDDDGVTDNDDPTPTPSPTPTPTPPDDYPVEVPHTQVPVKLLCSNFMYEQTRTSVREATSGITAAVYEWKKGGMLNRPQLGNPKLVFEQPAQTKKIWEDLMNEKTLKLNLSTLADGRYTIVLCDARAGSGCGLGGDVDMRVGLFDAQVFGWDNYIKFDVKNGRGTMVDEEAWVAYASGSIENDDGRCDAFGSPLIVDLDNSGIKLSKPLSGVNFDILGNGGTELISWPVKEANAFLALDVDGNGRIETVDELFGNNTGRGYANGFEALAKYDLNGDHRIDQQDPVFTKLKLWFDRNFNGVGELSELRSLDQGGIRDIDLNYEQMEETDIYGNKTMQRSIVHLVTGELRRIVDVWFRLL